MMVRWEKAQLMLLLAGFLGAPPLSARILFYDPALGEPAGAAAGPSAATGLTPVRTGGTHYVGVHYWFENGRGEKFADPAAAGVGSRISLHLRGNVPAFLTVWMSDASHTSVELTSRTHAGPTGRWTGYSLAADTVVIVSRPFVVASPGEDAERVIIFLARAQSEQVDSMTGAREKLQRIVARSASDGDSVMVHEVDHTTPGQIGTYVVHRTGGQAGIEILMAGQAPLDHVPSAGFRDFKAQMTCCRSVCASMSSTTLPGPTTRRLERDDGYEGARRHERPQHVAVSSRHRFRATDAWICFRADWPADGSQRRIPPPCSRCGRPSSSATLLDFC